ncbi:MAG: hypothetical protein MN733_29810 [Nitrososphaera sp.]|nr:hypothetical protein [Nitrososphaera sp.]
MPDLNELIETRQSIKAKLEAMDAEHEQRCAKFKAGLMQIEGQITEAMDAHGLQNVKTEHGTAYFTHPESMRVVDKEVFFEWVVANNGFDVLTSHVSKDAIRSRGEIPPGIEVHRVRKLAIRKS